VIDELRTIIDDSSREKNVIAAASKTLNRLEKSLKIWPDYQAALDAKDNNKFYKAKDFLTRVINEQDQWDGAYFERGTVMLKLHEYQAAFSDFEKAATLGRSSKSYANLALAASLLDDRQAELKALDMAVRLNTHNALLYFRMAVALMDHGKPDESIYYFKQTLARDKGNLFALFALVEMTKAYSKMGDVDNVLKGFIKMKKDLKVPMGSLQNLAEEIQGNLPLTGNDLNMALTLDLFIFDQYSQNLILSEQTLDMMQKQLVALDSEKYALKDQFNKNQGIIELPFGRDIKAAMQHTPYGIVVGLKTIMAGQPRGLTIYYYQKFHQGQWTGLKLITAGHSDDAHYIISDEGEGLPKGLNIKEGVLVINLVKLAKIDANVNKFLSSSVESTMEKDFKNDLKSSSPMRDKENFVPIDDNNGQKKNGGKLIMARKGDDGQLVKVSKVSEEPPKQRQQRRKKIKPRKTRSKSKTLSTIPQKLKVKRNRVRDVGDLHEVAGIIGYQDRLVVFTHYIEKNKYLMYLYHFGEGVKGEPVPESVRMRYPRLGHKGPKSIISERLANVDPSKFTGLPWAEQARLLDISIKQLRAFYAYHKTMRRTYMPKMIYTRSRVKTKRIKSPNFEIEVHVNKSTKVPDAAKEDLINALKKIINRSEIAQLILTTIQLKIAFPRLLNSLIVATYCPFSTL